MVELHTTGIPNSQRSYQFPPPDITSFQYLVELLNEKQNSLKTGDSGSFYTETKNRSNCGIQGL